MKHRYGLLFFVVLVWAHTAAARVLTPQDLVGVKKVSSPTVTPDSRTIFYTVTSYDLASNTGKHRIWSATLDGGGTAP